MTDIPGYRSNYNDSYGVFDIPYKKLKNVRLYCVVSDGDWKAAGLGPEFAWEHVSVRTKNRAPNWYQMDFIKDLFWDETETVMQLHVPKADHRNIHPHVLHLWRPLILEIPRPPVEAV